MRRRGIVLIVVSAALVLIAASVKSGWLYLVASVLVSLVAVGLFSGWSSTRRILLARESRRDAFEGEPVPVRLRVSNAGRMTRYFLVLTDLTFDDGGGRGLRRAVAERRRRMREALKGSGRDAAEAGRGFPALQPSAAVEKIAPGTSVDLDYRATAPRRGVYEGARVTVSSGGLFGSARFTRAADLEGRIVVYPRVYPLADFPLEPRARVAPLEALEWSRKGAGREYYGIREYVRGDTLRDIHWRSSARLGELIVKEYQQEFMHSAGVAVLLYEPGAGSAADNSLEDGLRCAASILNHYEAMGASPRLVLPADEGVECIEEADLFENLAALAAYRAPAGQPRAGGAARARAGADGDLACFFSAASDRLGGGSALALVTNATAEEAAAFLREAEGIEDSSLVLVLDGSYAPGWDTGDSLLEISKLEASAGRCVHLFVMTHGREIEECLSGQLSVIAR